MNTDIPSANTQRARDIEEAIVSMADERQAAVLQRFFKTKPGEYGAGDKFLGVRNPQVRSVVKSVWKSATLDDAEALVHSPLHEVRLCGLLIMVEMFRPLTSKESQVPRREIFQRYLSLHPFINNWDLVDLSAIKIAGAYELQHPDTQILDQWIQPGHTLWQRRIAMVSTWMSIRHHQYSKALRRAEALLDNQHDLLNKAAGWMLREVWKRGGKDELEDFLDKHVSRMPAVMLSYACEQMPPHMREYWRARR